MKNGQAKFSLQLLALVKIRFTQSKFFLLMLLSVALFGCGTGSGPASTLQTTSSPPLTLIWSDEFSGNSLDTAKWNYDTGYGDNGWGNDEWQLYTNSPNNVKVENGNLVITARCDYGACGKRDGTTTSGRITTKGKFYHKYGSFQARIKVPGGKGTWPAFWMLGTNQNIVGWPKCGEIDIMEVTKYGGNTTTHSTVHWWDQTLLNGVEIGWQYIIKNNTYTLTDSLGNDYHIYEVDWNEGRIIGKIDGITYFTKAIDPATMEEFLKNFYLLLNVAVGGNLAEDPNTSGASWPQTMYVDWVRVYGSTPFTPTASTYAGLFSETKTELVVPYGKIINSADWSGDSAIPNQTSTDVTPKEGAYVLAVQYLNDLGKGWNGIFFDLGSINIGNLIDSVSVIDFASFYFSVDASKFANFKDITVEFKDSANAAADLQLSSLTPTVSGNWATYQIPLKSITSANLSKLAFLGFMNPKNASGQKIPGTLYFDDMYFGASTASVKFSAPSYAANATKTAVTVSDPSTGGTTRPVTISNGTVSISVNVTLNASGAGSATVNFGATNDATDTIAISEGNTLTASYTDTSGAVTTTTAAITASTSTVVGDIAPKDGFVYLYATNPATVIDIPPGAGNTTPNTYSYPIPDWGSGTGVDMAYTADTTYNKVIHLTPGSGWGPIAEMHFTGLKAGFASTYTALHFKYKGATSVVVKFDSSGAGKNTGDVLLNSTSAVALANGWYEYTFDLTPYADLPYYTEFLIMNYASDHIYLTDIYFN